MPKTAIGAVILSKETQRVFLNLRSHNCSHPKSWGIPGGMSEKDESLIDTLKRECNEELGLFPTGQLIPFDVFNSLDGNFVYFTYVILIDKEFCPVLNTESAGYTWTSIGKWPEPLHPGLSKLLTSKSVKLNLKQILDFT